jgi:uncharacterized protein (TIGR01777 family)
MSVQEGVMARGVEEMARFVKRTELPHRAEEVFAWHAREGAFQRLVPPWQRIEILEKEGGIEEGARLLMRLRMGFVGQRWEALHKEMIEGEEFCDIQKAGPFASWEHRHRFEARGEGAVLEDSIAYAPPFGALGAALGGGVIRKMLKRMFAFRHERTRHDLMRHQAFAGESRKKIAMTGASGLLGQALTAYLTTAGHEVIPLIRSQGGGQAKGIVWSPSQGEIDLAALEGMDAVIHLSGENIAGRWTARKKEAILQSRVLSTRLIAQSLAKLKKPPAVLLSAAGISVYGDRGEEVVTEDAGLSDTFLAQVCKAWEGETQAAEDAGIRVAKIRISAVITSAGGALQKMLLPFRMGVGGVVGSGRQYMSWIAMDDLLGIFEHLLHRTDLQGVFNATAPHPITQAAFTKALGAALHRPTIFPLPAPIVRVLFGEMGDALLLESLRAIPQRLEASGFSFSYPHIEDALRLELGAFDQDTLNAGVELE